MHTHVLVERVRTIVGEEPRANGRHVRFLSLGNHTAETLHVLIITAHIGDKRGKGLARSLNRASRVAREA